MRPAEQFVSQAEIGGHAYRPFGARRLIAVAYRYDSLQLDVYDAPSMSFAAAMQFHRDMQEALAFMEEVKLLLEQDK